MTAVCGGGASSIKSSTAAVVSYSSGLIADLLVILESPWLIPVIPLLTLPPIVTASFCASDPPTPTALTSAEATALLDANFLSADFATGLVKMGDLVKYALWFKLCECTGAATPAPSPAPAAPAGTPIIYYPSTPGYQPCVTGNGGGGSLSGGSFTRGLSGNFNNVGIQSITITSVNTTTSGSGFTVDYIYQLQNNAGTTLSTTTRRLAPNTTDVVTVPWPSGATKINYSVSSVSGSGNYTDGGTKVDGYCSGSGYPTGTSTCPPDPVMMATLDAILRMVTLIQRQAVPFAYVTGPTHAALSGNGELTISEPSIGVQVDLTTIPSYLGVAAGDPDAHFDVGYVSLGDADGWFCSRRLAAAETVWLPRWAGAATRIGYSLAAGVVATIKELQREP